MSTPFPMVITVLLYSIPPMVCMPMDPPVPPQLSSMADAASPQYGVPTTFLLSPVKLASSTANMNVKIDTI